MSTAATHARSPAATVVTVVAALALVLAACTGGTGAEEQQTSDADRIAAIRQAREAVVGPAQALGTAAAEVAARLETLTAEPGPATVAATRTAVAGLVDARDEVDDLELDASTDDVGAATDALDEAAVAAGRLEEATSAVADAVERTAAIAEELGTVVEAWDERGSRSQLLARFEELEATARSLADEASPPEACPGPVEEATAAATAVADATAELREFVAQRDGNGFDARRAELDSAPFGTTAAGSPRELDGAVDPDGCPAVQEAMDAAAGVAAALRDLQQALNPADLES